MSGYNDCNCKNIVSYIRKITSENVYFNSRTFDGTVVGQELNEVHHQRRLEQEELKTLRAQVEIIREQKKSANFENELSKLKMVKKQKKVENKLRRRFLEGSKLLYKI